MHAIWHTQTASFSPMEAPAALGWQTSPSKSNIVIEKAYV